MDRGSNVNELRQEAEITKLLLDHVPEDKLEWRPHPKSMSLCQLALHLASVPGDVSQLAQLYQFDAANANFEPAIPDLKEMLIKAGAHGCFPFSSVPDDRRNYLRT